MYFADESRGDGIDDALAWTKSCVDSFLAGYKKKTCLAIYLDGTRVSVVSGHSPATARAELPDSVFENGDYLVVELRLDGTWRVVDRQGFGCLSEQARADMARIFGGRWLEGRAREACRARHPAGKMLQAASS